MIDEGGNQIYKIDVPADVKTGVPVQDGVTGAAETPRVSVPKAGEVVKGLPVPPTPGEEKQTLGNPGRLRIVGDVENAPHQSPAATASPRGSRGQSLTPCP